MTEEEADALDELWTRTTPEIDMTKPGYYSTRMAHLVEVDDFTAVWLRARVDATRKTSAEIIGELVREKIAASV
jgi:hypothetical protein